MYIYRGLTICLIVAFITTVAPVVQAGLLFDDIPSPDGLGAPGGGGGSVSGGGGSNSSSGGATGGGGSNSSSGGASGGGGSNSSSGAGSGGSGASQCNPGDPGCLSNPLGYNSLAQFLAAVLDAVVLIAFPFLILALVYAGFLFVMAQGNEQKLSEARRTFIWVLLGALLVLGAKALAAAINATVGELRERENVSLPYDHPLVQNNQEANIS